MRELTPEIIRSLTPDQVELLIELGELARKEFELTSQIDAIRRQEEKVGLKPGNRAVKAIYEDSEFDELLSLRAVRERFGIQDRIASLIRSLVAARLGDLAIVRRQAANYGLELPQE